MEEKFYRPVGERFKFRDVKLEVTASFRCDGCYFYENDHHQNVCQLLQFRSNFTREELLSPGLCTICSRSDNQSVIFKLVKE